MKKAEIRAAYEQEIEELGRAWGADAQSYIGEIAVLEADLEAAKGREIHLRTELAQANAAWTNSQAELRDVVEERDKLRRQLQAVRAGLEPLTTAVYPIATRGGDVVAALMQPMAAWELQLLNEAHRADNAERLHHAGYTCPEVDGE